MVYGYILFAVFIFVIYNTTHENTRFAPSPSAIRQVWTGQCGIMCAHGLHNLGATPCGRLVVPLDIPTRHTECVCDACPCALIQHYFLSAARQCVRSADAIAQCYTDFTNRLDMLVSDIRYSGARHAQMVEPSRPSWYNESDRDFRLVERTGQQKNICLVSGTQSDGKVGSVASCTQYGYSLVNKMSEIAAELTLPIQQEVLMSCTRLSSKVSNAKTNTTDEDKLDPRKNCSKCVEQGKTCYKDCPNAEKKRRKLSNSK